MQSSHSQKTYRNRSLSYYLRKLLFPFSIIYASVVWVRNLFFDWGWIPSHRFEIPVISIGNITVGGTGKTPHAEYLIRLLQPHFSLTLISRGYRRKTKGVVVASSLSSASDIGDEPKQLLDKFSNIRVVVAEKRVEGINAALSQSPQPHIILMDDAYQHRHVKPGFSILLMDYHRPLWCDCMLPAGDLREPQRGKKRAQLIVVTKCPADLSMAEASIIEKKISPTSNQKVFFSTFQYGQPISLIGGDQTQPSATSALALAGIARPEPFYDHLMDAGYQVRPLTFADHHHFTASDMALIEQKFMQLPEKSRLIFTTEKDAVRLRESNLLSPQLAQNIWVIPIEVVFLFGQQENFNHQINEYVSKNKSNL